MARPAEPGRTALLEAGRRLLSDRADGRSLSRLSVNAVVAEASMSKGAFFQHFPTRSAYMLTLHARFHDHLWERVRSVTDGIAPGRERLERGIGTYLDVCRELALTKAFLFQSRADIDLCDAVAEQNRRFAHLAARDLAAIGRQDPGSIARLVVAAVAEVAIAEAATGRRDARLRRALSALSTGEA